MSEDRQNNLIQRGGYLVESIRKLSATLTVSAVLWCLPVAAMAQSGSSGTGVSMACTGGAPYYCARTDRAIVSIPSGFAPSVNTPTVNEFGETYIRLTDRSTMAAFGSANANFFPLAADTVPQWSNYDPLACSGAGGYRLFVDSQGGYPSNLGALMIPFEVCPSTMTVVKVAGLTSGNSGLHANGFLNIGNPSFSFGDPAVMWFQSGQELESYCYPDASPSDPNCPNGPDHTNAVFNLASCPNLPSNLTMPGYPGGTVGTYTDISGRYVETADYIGQNGFGMIMIYDTQTGDCTWFSPGTWQWGGTGQIATHINGGGLGDPSSDQGLLAAPSVTPVTGTGTLPAGTYYTKWVGNGQQTAGGAFQPRWNLNGQSAGSQEQTTVLSATGEIEVTPPSCYLNTSAWCSSPQQPYWILYAGTTSGGETLQNAQLLGSGTNTPTVSGTLTENLTAYTGSNSQIVVVAGNQVLYDSGSGTLCQFILSNGTNNCPGTIVYNAGAVTATFANNVPTGTPVYVEWWYPPSTQETISAPLVTNTPTSPTVSTAGTGLHYANMNAGGTYIWLEGEGTNANNGSFYWQIGTNNFSFCTPSSGCTGHVAPGFNNQKSVACVTPVVACTVDLDTAPISSPSTFTTLLKAPPVYLPSTCPPQCPTNPAGWYGNTQHISWTDDNSSDTYPFLNGYSPTAGFLQPYTALQYELFAASTSYPATVYRFAHTRSSGLTYMGGSYSFFYSSFGGISPDGKWADFSTSWNNSLGFNAAPWAASSSLSQGNERVDSNNNLEVETALSCTTGSTHPAWATAIGGFTTGSGPAPCSWVLLGIYGQPFAGPVWNASAYYQSGAYIVDTSGRLQEETIPTCMSGSSTPSWTNTTTPGDGTCSWTYIEVTGLPSAPGAVSTGLDTFVVELK